MSTLAVFLVIGGGTAVAAFVITDNSQVAPGTISGHSPPSGDHANIIADSLNGQDIAPNRLGGGQINESTLGKVPNADALDGIDSSGFIQGSGQIMTISTSAVNGDSTVMFDVPGFIRAYGICNGTGSPINESITTRDLPVTAVWDTGGGAPGKGTYDANTAVGSSAWNLNPAGDSITFSFAAGAGKVATAFIFASSFHSSFLHQDVCKFQGHVIVSGV